MPDVTRSDSQRSDASHKPRVSFNRDVHVKRIGREGVVAALAGDGEGHLVPLPVRRERPGRLSRRELEKEAESILRQAERVNCTPTTDKFSTLPSRHSARNKHAHPTAASVFNSLDRRGRKPRDPEPQGQDSVRLKRRFSNPDTSWGAEPQRRRLNRSVSDAGRREEKKDKEFSIFGTLDRMRKKDKKKPPVLEPREEIVPPVRKKKQLSPIMESSPAQDPQEPWRFSSGGGGVGGDTVVYAEVVARPSGKTTVHTAVSADPSQRPQHHHAKQGSDEDEGVDMGHRGALGRRYSYESDILRSSPKEYSADIKKELDIIPKRKDDEIREDKIINMLRSKSNPLLDEEVVGGYRREVRTERVIRMEGADEPDGRGRADGMDYTTRRRASKDFFEEETHLKNNFSDVKIHSYDDLDRIKYQEPIRAWTPPLETSLIDSNNLSYRRDRLESRLTNHRRRFLSTAHQNKGYRDENVKQDLRKDFLISQLNDDKEKGYFEKRIATEIDTHHRQQLLKNKDVLADSGIEMSDYRKESSKDVATLNRRNAETTRVIRTETTRTKSTPALNHSDGEKRYKGDISTKFIQEERRKTDVIPTSSTLVKNYAKPSKEDHKVLKKEEKLSKEKKKEKLTRMEKVKQLMFGNKESKKNKKNKKQDEEAEELLRTRYTEYKGSDVSVNSSPVIHRRRQTSSSEVDERTDQEREVYGSRARLATPSPSNGHPEDGWFKSLTRRNKHSKDDKKLRREEEGSKHLRFFGDSDRESVKSGRRPSPSRHTRHGSNPHLLQVPQQRHGHTRRSAPDSSAESTTEGEHSNHSQKSVVYLHAATVGDIPGSRKLHRSVVGGRRSQSREELSSSGGGEVITPQTRALSRSVSVLAPWRPKHIYDGREVQYDSEGRPPKPPKQPRNTLEKQKKNLRELRKSKENLDAPETPRGRGSSESVLTENRRSRGNLVFVGKRESYGRDEVDTPIGTATMGRHQREKREKRDLARSVSIPRDNRVSSGWFKGKNK